MKLDRASYLMGYDDAGDGRGIECNHKDWRGSSQLSYLMGYRQQMLDHMRAVNYDIKRTLKATMITAEDMKKITDTLLNGEDWKE